MKGYQVIIENTNNDSPCACAGDIVYINIEKAKEAYSTAVDAIMNDTHLWIKHTIDNFPQHLITEKTDYSVTFSDFMSDNKLSIYINEVTIIY